MKRFIVVLLVICLFLPGLSFADDPDPISGCYYLYYDKSVTPELATSFGSYDRIIAVYTFLNDGTIVLLEHDVEGTTGIPSYNSAGKWEHDAADYKYSIIGLGEGRAYIKDDCIFLGLMNNTVYMKLHKLFPFNPYSDYQYH